MYIWKKEYNVPLLYCMWENQYNKVVIHCIPLNKCHLKLFRNNNLILVTRDFQELTRVKSNAKIQITTQPSYRYKKSSK